MAYLDDPETQRANMAYIKASMDAPMLEKSMSLTSQGAGVTIKMSMPYMK